MPYNIRVSFEGGLTATQRIVFDEAASRWAELIAADVPGVVINGENIDDLLISARGVVIDGSFGTLGRAGPTHVRTGSLLPAKGIMEFDTSDLDRMEADGSLLNVVIHEMAHVIGIGTIWHAKGFVSGTQTANPRFTGANAMREFGSLLGNGQPLPVPLANTGGEGTREGHWRESVFDSELMTGFIDAGSNPISRITLAALEDLGYGVDLTSADDYQLPTALEIAMRGIGAERPNECCSMCGLGRRFRGPVIVPEDSFVKRPRKKSQKRTARQRPAAMRTTVNRTAKLSIQSIQSASIGGSINEYVRERSVPDPYTTPNFTQEFIDLPKLDNQAKIQPANN